MVSKDIYFSDPTTSEVGLSSNAQGQFIFPKEIELFRATFIRDGSDLLVQSSDGNGLRLSDYFLQAEPSDLLSHDGAVLRGHIVERLAGPAFPGQYAQQGGFDLADAIGQVEVLEGVAFVQRTDGQTVELEVGTKVFQGDVVQTEDGSTLSLTFADGTIFTLAAASRMVLDELIYDPQGSDNSGIFNLVEGSFVFIAGQTARTGGIEINTPAATMGIRGTTGKIDIQTISGIASVSVSLNPDPDGGLGLIQLFDLDGNLISNIAATDTKWIVRPPFTNEPPIEITRVAADLADDSVLLSRAMAAFQEALARVRNGETFVDLPEGVQRGIQNSQEEEEDDLENAPGFRPPPLDETGEGGGPGGPGRGNPELDGNNRPSLQQESGKSDDDQAIQFTDFALRSTEDTPLTSQIPFATGSLIEVSLARGAENGFVVLASDGTFTYTPNTNFEGLDSFEVSGIDETGTTQTAQVTVIVDPVNDSPVANTDSASTNEDTPVTLSVLPNDS
ncbi:Ig-like domain-containing protein, partial [Marimonas sp. MJW-29]